MSSHPRLVQSWGQFYAHYSSLLPPQCDFTVSLRWKRWRVLGWVLTVLFNRQQSHSPPWTERHTIWKPWTKRHTTRLANTTGLLVPCCWYTCTGASAPFAVGTVRPARVLPLAPFFNLPLRTQKRPAYWWVCLALWFAGRCHRDPFVESLIPQVSSHRGRWLRYGGIRGRRLDEADCFLGCLSLCLANRPVLRCFLPSIRCGLRCPASPPHRTIVNEYLPWAPLALSCRWPEVGMRGPNKTPGVH